MVNAPVRFRRVAAAFEEGAARVRLCESSGSEHSAAEEDSPDLSDLVNSFMEWDGDAADMKRGKKKESEDAETYSENKDRLRTLLIGDGDDAAKQMILEQTQLALELIVSRGPGFKRQLMSRLRDGGLDAGLCKSRWEKKGNLQAGSYEYVDVNVNGSRYIIEVLLAEEFAIARATTRYDSLLGAFPEIFVGKVEELKQISRVMCGAAKESMKRKDMPMAPWRRNSYSQAKWVSSYKRTTNAALGQDSYGVGPAAKRSVGFDSAPVPVRVPGVSYYCRGDFGGKMGGLRVGHLSAVLSSSSN